MAAFLEQYMNQGDKMTFTTRIWKNIKFFSRYGYYDKIINTLKIIEREGSTGEIFTYFGLEEPGSFENQTALDSKLIHKLFLEALGFLERVEGKFSLTEDGNTVLENHKTGEINYNKQVVFLYLARNTGGFLNIFYSMREGARIDRSTMMERVNQERVKEELPPRKRWRDFTERLEWFYELGIARQFDDGTFMLTYSGNQLLIRMQKKKAGESGEPGEDGPEDELDEEGSARRTRPVSTLNQLPEGHRDITTGPIKNRKYGIRVDDEVTVYVVGGDTLRVIEGQVLHHKSGLHLVDSDGYYHRISYDWVTDIVIKKHNRPHPKNDKEYTSKRKRKKKRAAPKESASMNNAYL